MNLIWTYVDTYVDSGPEVLFKTCVAMKFVDDDDDDDKICEDNIKPILQHKMQKHSSLTFNLFPATFSLLVHEVAMVWL